MMTHLPAHDEINYAAHHQNYGQAAFVRSRKKGLSMAEHEILLNDSVNRASLLPLFGRG
jgi:hypothetical protein